MKNLYRISIIICVTVISGFSQSKYNGSQTPCDSTLLPSPETFKIHLTNVDRTNDNLYHTYYTLPCDVLYEIEQRRKQNETVQWQWNNFILIEIFPQNHFKIKQEKN